MRWSLLELVLRRARVRIMSNPLLVRAHARHDCDALASDPGEQDLDGRGIQTLGCSVDGLVNRTTRILGDGPVIIK